MGVAGPDLVWSTARETVDIPLPDPAVKGAKVGYTGPTAGHDIVSSDLKWSGERGILEPKVTVE